MHEGFNDPALRQMGLKTINRFQRTGNSPRRAEKRNIRSGAGRLSLQKEDSFQGKGKSGSGRTIICYKKGARAIFIHGFAKNEKDNLSSKELLALKEFSKTLVSLTEEQIATAVKNGDFKEVSK